MTRIIKKGVKAPANAVKIITGRLGGKWLETLGFIPGDVLTVAASPGAITYQVQHNGIARTLELVKFARENKLRLIQVLKQGKWPYIEIPRSALKKAGLAADEPLFAIYEPGLLILQKSGLS